MVVGWRQGWLWQGKQQGDRVWYGMTREAGIGWTHGQGNEVCVVRLRG